MSALGIPRIRGMAAPAARRRRDLRGSARCLLPAPSTSAPSCSCRCSRKADGWSRLSPFAGEDRFTEIPMADAGRIAGLDPLFVNGACRLDLADDPGASRSRRATASGRSPSTIRPARSSSA